MSRRGKINSNIGRLNWGINSLRTSQRTTHTQLKHTKTSVELGHQPDLSQLCPVVLGYQHEPQQRQIGWPRWWIRLVPIQISPRTAEASRRLRHGQRPPPKRARGGRKGEKEGGGAPPPPFLRPHRLSSAAQVTVRGERR